MMKICNNSFIKKIHHITNYILKTRKKKVYCGKILAISLILAFFVGVGIFHTITAVKGNQRPNSQYKYYTSITIEYGDSLWSIAEQYCETQEEMSSYVQEIKKINGLSQETIHAGNSLVVYYYSNEYK